MHTHLFQVHRLHGIIHTPHYSGHTARDLPHCHCCLHPTGYSIDSRAQPKQIQFLILFPDGILRIDLGDVWMVLLYGLEASLSAKASLAQENW